MDFISKEDAARSVRAMRRADTIGWVLDLPGEVVCDDCEVVVAVGGPLADCTCSGTIRVPVPFSEVW